MLQAVCHTPVKPLSRHGNFSAVLGNFFCGVFLSGRCSGFVSLRRTYYGLVQPFLSLSFSPVVRRGKSCSGNRGLGIVIRAENSRFLLSPGFPAGTLAARDMVAKTPYFPETISCPALILGESGDSGHNSGFGWTWKEADNSERISGESLEDSQNQD
jgi:hypothetical protein